MFLHHRRRLIHKKETLSDGVKVLAWSRAVRWIGWGLAEALLPVFILQFSNTFAEMGILSSTVDIASLVSLPIIGMWADKVPARKLVLWSLALYPLVGASYFIAGAYGMAAFVVIARIVNGFTWELENVGIETYYRRMTDEKTVARSFGYIETWSHVAWIGAALIGIILVRFVPIHWLLLGIAPFALIAWFMVFRAPRDRLVRQEEGRRVPFLRAYGMTIREMRSWNSRLWLLGVLVLFSSIVSSLMYFFVPIDAFIDGANLPMVVLITVVGAIPALFGWKLGALADDGNKYALIGTGLFGVAAVSLGLYLIPAYWFKLVAMFVMGVILELFYVAESSLVTTLGPEETYGERGSAFEGVTVLGDMVAPLILGVSLDMLGFGNVALTIACTAFALAIVFRVVREVGR